MHIPDGYLGPATYISLFIVMLPIWIVAFKKTSKDLGPKQIPMVSLLSAFSFIVMMFNWPVPDGTTAHMVGGTLMAILVGPWAAVVGISIALLIQAVVFADGGLLAFGANSFNMAVILPFVGYYLYKLLSKKLSKPLSSAIAAYIALNAAALTTAVEFGIQPYIAPGYCPYGLNVAVPAMMFAHLTTAGPVAAVVTGAVIAYLEKTRPDILEIRSVGKGYENSPEINNNENDSGEVLTNTREQGEHAEKAEQAESM